MPAERLPHYIRTFRRRSGLTQRELAWLLGCESRSKVSHYERFVRKPSLETILAFELVFQAPAQEIFAGIAEAVATVTKRRAKTLLRRLQEAAGTPETNLKLCLLKRLCGEVDETIPLRRDA